MKKREKRHASAEKKGASGLSPRAPSPETTTSGTQRPLGAGSPARGRRSLGLAMRSQRLGWRGSLLLGQRSRLQLHLPPDHACLAAFHVALSPYSPGDPRRGAVGARGHLGRGAKGVRGSPRPGGHGGRPPQGGSSRRRPRSRAPRPGPGWGHGGGSALRRGAGRGRSTGDKSGRRAEQR